MSGPKAALKEGRKRIREGLGTDEPGPVDRCLGAHHHQLEGVVNGKPVSIARDVDIFLAIEHFRYYAGWADKGMCGKTIPTYLNDIFSMTVHEPVGTVGCVIPWNFPILMLAWKWGPLLACGCTCVMKSSEKVILMLFRDSPM